MYAVVFSGLDGKPAKISDVVSGDFQENDEIQIFSESGAYDTYFYSEGKWFSGLTFEESTNLLPVGTSFWVKTAAPTQITLKGAVLEGDYSYMGRLGYQMVSFGVPKEVPLNGDSVVWENLTNNDELQIRNGESYKTYFYNDGAWYDGVDFSRTTDKVPIGASVWLRAQNAAPSFVVKGLN